MLLERPRGAARRSAADLRLAIYLAALAAAVGLDAALEGPRRGSPFWSACAAVAACLALGWVVRGPVLRVGAAGAAALALAFPLGPALASGEPLGTVLSSSPLWPQVLVALFASRVLAEDCEMRFARFWQAPGSAPEGVSLQSTMAAVALGGALTLTFYQFVWWLAPAGPAGTGTAAIVLAAFTGETAIHRAILFLFFVILGFLFDAALRHGRARAVFRALRAVARSGADRGLPLRAEDLGRVIARDFADCGHLRGVRLVDEACARATGRRGSGQPLATASFDLFHGSARRFVRALLPILPMLGFFGTVVGLATAMAALPTSAPEGGGVDISASLSGLAVKFQTTLLGILASLLASAFLAALDRAEAELAAECLLFVAEAEAVRHG